MLTRCLFGVCYNVKREYRIKKPTFIKSSQHIDQRQVLHLARGLLDTQISQIIYLFIIYVHYEISSKEKYEIIYKEM